METIGKARLICWYKNSFTRDFVLEQPGNEILVLKHKKNTIVGLYRPFKCHVNESLRSNFERLVDNLYVIGNSTGHCNLLVVGDFNVHGDKFHSTSFGRILEEWADRYILEQVIN